MPEFSQNTDFKIDSPLEYTPFKMKAADYGNSPMRKNFGIGDSEMAIKTESPGKSKDGSPLFKGGMFGRAPGGVRAMIQKIRASKMAATGGVDAAAGPVATDPAAMEAEAMAADPVAAAEGGEGGVAPHGPEAHTGGGAVGRAPKPRGIMGNFGKFKGGSKFGKQIGRGGLGNLASDIRLKENINKTGVSPSGIPIYEFNYIGSTNRYSGAMAQDLLETNPDAVSMDTSGYYKVNYNNIDVDMHLID
jgi:hypothetical protein